MSRPLLLLLVALVACAGLVAGEEATKVAAIKFKSCPKCKLSHLPEVKKFLVEVVAEGKYPGVTVDFIQGALPEVFMVDENGKEFDKMYIEHLSFAELNTLVRSRGFRRVDEKDVARRRQMAA
ncbi:hypothetical protein FOA52_001401 [Chlamydomonas sp. UWO 241]|nr:hypothetical protein FOA52_001401 [Chlamydomonas sp. UWO 241]